MIIRSKLDNSALVYGLTLEEFKCKCEHPECRVTFVNPDLLNAYLKLRIKVNMSLKINSGFRCMLHNKDVGGQPRSRHLVGDALDIDLTSLLTRYNRETLRVLLEHCGFTFIKFYDSFVHVDVRPKV